MNKFKLIFLLEIKKVVIVNSMISISGGMVVSKVVMLFIIFWLIVCKKLNNLVNVEVN